MNKMNPKETQEELLHDGIRKATVDDIPEAERINVECRKHNYKGIVAQEYLDELHPGDKLEKWEERFLTGNESYYVKVLDGKVVGMIS